MAEGIESGFGGVWQAPQTTPGTRERADATRMRRLQKPGDGGLRAAKAHGSEEHVDGRYYGSPTAYVTEIGGPVGDLEIKAQLEIEAFQWAQLFAVDVVTGAADPWTHTITYATRAPALQTFYQAVGVDVGPVNQVFYDAKVGRLARRAGQNQMVAHLTMSIIALFAAEWFTTAPTAREIAGDALLWSEATTTINGVTLPELSGDTVEVDAGVGVHRGQTAAPAAFTYAKGMITRALDGIVTDGLLPIVLRSLYNDDTPADRAPISNSVTYIDAVSRYVREAGRRELTIDTPRVEVRSDDLMVAPRAEGGASEIALGGRCFENGSEPAITIVALTGDRDPYV